MQARFNIQKLLIIFLSTFVLSAQADKKMDDKIEKWLKRNGAPGASIQIYSHGKLKTYSYGLADREKKIPVTEETIFEIASVTKIFTALLLAEEVIAGRMKLSDTLANYLTDIPATPSNKIKLMTLENLATHTSGLPFNAPKSVNSKKKLSTYLSKWKNPSSVGTHWLYSNINIGLIGYLLERQTQETIYELYERKILNPLGMRSSGALVPDSLMKYYAQGYNTAGKPAPRRNMKVWISPPNSDWIFPATGSLKSSGRDMGIFLKATLGLPGTPPLMSEAMKLTQTSFIKTPRFEQGLAWVIHPNPIKNKAKLLALKPKSGPHPVTINFADPTFNGDALMEKTGASGGFRSYIGVIPGEQVGVVLMVNRYITSSELLHMGRDLVLNQ